MPEVGYVCLENVLYVTDVNMLVFMEVKLQTQGHCCVVVNGSLPAATSKLVCQLLHLPALTPPPLSMRQLLEAQDSSSSSSSREAVLFITTPGADPSQELAAFAEGQASGPNC